MMLATANGDVENHGTGKEVPLQPPPRRVHLTVSAALHEKMKEAQAETNADTLADVVRDALITYLALVREHKGGKEIVVRDQDSGRETNYALFMRH